MAHPKPNNIFGLNDPLYILLDHIIREQDIALHLIGIEPYYQHGVPAPPLFSPGSDEFLYLCRSLTVFRQDQTAQMNYVVQDENAGLYLVISDSIVAVGPSLYTAKGKQENFLVRNIPIVNNITDWEFVGWRLTLST